MANVSELISEARAFLRLDPATVADAAQVDTTALLRYESSEADVPGDVLWRLSDVLGVPFEDLSSAQELDPYLRAMSVRFRGAQQTVPPSLRLAVTRAAGAALDFVALEEIADRPSRYEGLRSRFPNHPFVSGQGKVWEAGKQLAEQVRATIGSQGPISSVLRTAREIGVLVLWQRLPSEIAGYAFCDAIHGPTMILNVNGRNANELVRRFTQAHELCHILFEKDRLQSLSTFDSYEDFFAEWITDPFEVRANAFAIHFLAPQQEFQNEWARHQDVRQMMVRFGLSYEAVRRHLANTQCLPHSVSMRGVSTAAPDEWKSAESSELWYPAFDVIPIERRHFVAELAFSLWRKEQITFSRLREVLRTELSREQALELAELYDQDTQAAE